MPQASDYLDEQWEIGQTITYSFNVGLLGYGEFSSYYEYLFESAMSQWSSVANITFQETNNPYTADWIIGWQYIDGFGGTLGYNVNYDLDNDGVLESGNAEYSLIVMDYLDTFYFYGTAIHEVGHALGIAHIDHTPSIMATYENGVSGLTSYDIAVIQSIYGAPGSTTDLIGSEGSDNLIGDSSDNTLSGGSGSDTLLGGTGKDIIYGNLETDQLSGGSGDDTIYGGQNNGPASTGVGNASDGTSKQREGTEYVLGGDGNDVIYGNYGSDVLSGGAGNDKLFGGQDSDTLSGGSGNDTLYGNRGDDTLIGGSGSDVFVIQTNTISTVTISDFNVAEDYLQANASRLSITDTSSGALVNFSNGSTVTLSGVSSASLLDQNFI